MPPSEMVRRALRDLADFPFERKTLWMGLAVLALVLNLAVQGVHL